MTWLQHWPYADFQNDHMLTFLVNLWSTLLTLHHLSQVQHSGQESADRCPVLHHLLHHFLHAVLAAHLVNVVHTLNTTCYTTADTMLTFQTGITLICFHLCTSIHGIEMWHYKILTSKFDINITCIHLCTSIHGIEMWYYEISISKFKSQKNMNL